MWASWHYIARFLAGADRAGATVRINVNGNDMSHIDGCTTIPGARTAGPDGPSAHGDAVAESSE